MPHSIWARTAWVQVDPDDFARLMKYRWHLVNVGTGSYAVSTIEGKRVFMHRMVMGVDDPEVIVDHINRDKLDNRRENLRTATAQQNSFNVDKHSDNTSGHKGVTWDKLRRKWVASIVKDGKRRFLGRFDTAEEAARTYDDAAELLFGEFKGG